MKTSSFYSKRWKGEKNGRRICPINDVLTSAYTWATPQNSLCARRAYRHDA
jgi:hypothetical protein